MLATSIPYCAPVSTLAPTAQRYGALVTISYTHMGNEADRVYPLSWREPSVVVVEVTGGVRYAT
jgi:hypothetical protein